MKEIWSNYCFLVNWSYLTQNLTVLGVLGVVLKLTGMAIRTRAQPVATLTRNLQGFSYPLLFPICL